MNQSDSDEMDVTDDQAEPTRPNTSKQSVDFSKKQFGRYDVVGFLGKGGFGAVYEGFDQHLRRKVAIKVPLLKRVRNSDFKRYQVEAQNLARLQHRGIVSVFDVGLEDGQFYFVTEMLEGVSLSKWISKNNPSWQESADLISQIAEAVAHAHARKVIHRDIKPDNIVLVPDRGPVLVDFGLALSGQSSGDEIGNVCGTVRYMAPEQVEGLAHRIDGRTDIHALGVILYQLLTGSVPYDATDQRELKRQILQDEPQPPRQLDLSIPQSIEKVCMKALSKSVSKRQTTALDIASQLTSARRQKVSNSEFSMGTAEGLARQPTADLSDVSQEPVRSSSAKVAGRRHVSILHVSMAVRSAAGEGGVVDPEDQFEAIARFKSACDSSLKPLGGNPLPGGGQEMLICFGYPLSYEDAPRRAVLAAIAVRDAMVQISPDLQSQLGVRMQVWISVHSGMVITAGPDSDSLIGDVLTLVTKIDRETEPGEVVVTAETHGLIENHFECTHLAATCALPGEEPIALLRVDRAHSADHQNLSAEEVEYTPLVGRDQEVGMLRDRWDLVQEGYGQIVALIGEAGLGKSRLIQELRQRVNQKVVGDETSPIIEWSCSQFHVNSAFHPAKEALRRILSFERDEPAESQCRRLRDHLDELGLDLKQSLPLFCDLLSLPYDPEFPRSELSSPRQKELTLEYLFEWLCIHARQRPTLFIVEDLHWMDPSSLDLLTRFAAAPIADPLLCVFSFRPEFTTPWASCAHQTQIALNRLTRIQVSQIIKSKAEGSPVPAGMIDRIASRTDGVPLFVEEYAKMLIDSSNAEVDTISQWPDSTQGSRGGSVSIPTTLQGLLTARLDRIGGDPIVVRSAAALGREFTHQMISLVCDLPESTLEEELNKLVDSELLFRRGVGENCSYLFKHALIQDAAYDAMLRRQRQEIQRRIADALETHFPETGQQRPELLAHHRTEAGQHWPAVPLWEAAGTNATDRGAFVEAVGHLLQAMASLEASTTSSSNDFGENDRLEQEYRINVPLGIATLSLKGYAAPELGAIYDRRMELCTILDDAMGQLHAKWAMGSWKIVRDEVEVCIQIGRDMMVMAEAMQDDGARMEARFILAIGQFYHGEFEECHKSCTEGLKLYEPERCLFHTSRTGQHAGVANLCYMALCNWYLGDPEAALARMEEAREMAESLNHPFTVAFFLHHYSWLNTAMRRGEQAIKVADELIAVSQEQAFFFWETTGMLFGAGGMIAEKRYEEALERLTVGLARYDGTGAELALSQYHAFLAETQMGLGLLDDAESSLEHAIQLVAKTVDRFHEPELWRLRGQLAKLRGDHAAAIQNIVHAGELAAELGSRSWELSALVDLAELTAETPAIATIRQQIADLIPSFESSPVPIPIVEQAKMVLG